MPRLSLTQAVRLLYLVAALLMADVLVRAIVGGYGAAHISGGDSAIAIVTAWWLVVRRRQRAA